MSRRRRGRIIVQNQPTGAARGMMRLMGAVHAVFGLTFVAVAATQIIPSAGLFGLPFLAGGLFFAINGIRMLVSKNDIAHRVGYDIETDIQEETILGLMDEAPPSRGGKTRPHSPAPLDARERLEQLQDLKSAGLISGKEFDQKRQEILDEL